MSTDESRIQLLLDELLSSHATPETVCQSCPELLSVVRDRWQFLRRVQADLDALLPFEVDTLPASLDDSQLPRIEGYEVEEILGRGGMGIVFRACHLGMQRQIALKMALYGAYGDRREQERFQREIKTVARLRHTSIVQIYEMGDFDGRPYFTMEFVEGGTLSQKLCGNPLPAAAAARLVATLADAIQAAHACGVVHRDLKPGNILLTSDGMPKISDFGLARRLDDGDNLTQTGVIVGTPSYMSPEQARVTAEAAGPASDIYALGAILYELLTGRPPFRGATSAETIQQLLSQDAVRPSQLNAKVPRDLETICLKCLRKPIADRYQTARDLQDDLSRFLRGDAIKARPEGVLQRFVRRVRHNPVASTAAVLAIALSATLLWFAVDRWTVNGAVRDDIQEMIGWQQKSAWPEARAALVRAKARLAHRTGTGSALPLSIQRGEAELNLVERLEQIRLESSPASVTAVANKNADREYEHEFQTAGFGSIDEIASHVARRISVSPIRAALVNSLDDWAIRATDEQRRNWILDVASQADDDPAGWRIRARTPQVFADSQALAQHLEQVDVKAPFVPLFLFLADQMAAKRMDSFPFLKRVEHAHPSDFCVNFQLGKLSFERRNYADGIRYYYAALVLRPDSPALQMNLALALENGGQTTESLPYFQEAIRLSPRNSLPVQALARAYIKLDSHAQAAEQLKAALKMEPTSGFLYWLLGQSKLAQRDIDGAIAAYQQAADNELDRRRFYHQEIRRILFHERRSQEAVQNWLALQQGSLDHNDYYGFAEFCLFLGDEERFQQGRTELVQKFGQTDQLTIAERLSRTCLLMPGDGPEFERAIELAERAGQATVAEVQGFFGPYQFALGLAEFRQGKFESAANRMSGPASTVLKGQVPRLIWAMSQHQLGNAVAARKAYMETVMGQDWTPTLAANQDDYIRHIIRREAERMIVPDLVKDLQDDKVPQDHHEQLVLIAISQSSDLPRATARLFKAAFDQHPDMRLELSQRYAYQAARAAAQAGCGLGNDSHKSSDSEKTQHLNEALEWLQFDLNGWRQLLTTNANSYGYSIRKSLSDEHADPGFFCIRTPAALQNIPADQRKRFQSFWAEFEQLRSVIGK